MRIKYYFKLFLLCVLLWLIVLITINFTYIRNTGMPQQHIETKIINTKSKVNRVNIKGEKVVIKVTEREENLKYILLWTNPINVPFTYIGKAQSGFTERKCPYTNCYVTGNRHFFRSYTEFDVIAFSGPEIANFVSNTLLPSNRSMHQKFVFASMESSHKYPVCHDRFNNFFNWTWTYKLDSDARWGYIVVRDINDNIIGPNKIMNWISVEDMDLVSGDDREKLKRKTKAAAWFVSNCQTKSRREDFVKDVQEELRKFDLSVDIYGWCGDHKCSDMNKCSSIIEKNYYFYFAFENAFSEDYVTEKLLHGLQNYAVPVVYGGANYTRFMPDGIYLNARELGPKKLTARMAELIEDPSKYEQFFRWRNHYKFFRRAESLETDDYCNFCAMLNNEELVKKTTIYEDFKKWWTPSDLC